MALAVFNPKVGLTLSLTETAANFFGKQLATKKLRAIRLSIKKSGCTGYAYVIDTVNDPEEGDSKIVLKEITFYVSAKSEAMISGSEIDLLTQGINKSIVFNNPNITVSCGCGSSFSVE